MEDFGLYIHIPFCTKKCFYCDFTSFPDRMDIIEKYIDCLIQELSFYKGKLKNHNIKTIFIGGGTPSSIDGKYIYKVLDYIYSNYTVDKTPEITIEINPGTLTKDKANIYKKSGINRISMGLQTFNRHILKSIGRSHTPEEFYDSYDILNRLGFKNINVDLIFGLPNQALKDIIYDLKQVTKLNINHISYYSLIIEAGTLMNKWYEEGKLDLPNEDEERQMYYYIVDTLIKNGFTHYEISNFARDNYQCIHNNIYWKVKPYLGIGLGSHSNIMGKRFWNVDRFHEYFSLISKDIFPIAGEEIIDKETEISEFCILGLRLIEGINKKEFRNRFHINIEDIFKDQIAKHINNSLLIEDQDSLHLSPKGLDLANLVEVDFLL
ncbi:radical SAM family heme chaperone HemW [Wansuia hejianensis]|uniref:Heme chaperone HemW n=1 Tax=Wansuia hejianensis TaxID=2763667 RepID=A0A926EZX7_9FIRM|nr:radical SAM family heme chaperone HemW [Wansuia hejianensis]MBC8590781.1 oxygen-independent coproporphyrinogen III oxidase [Wansuia hejianensis]